ncbi:tRNA (guanine-N1-)-methyltransferase [Archaeoglobus veneficus]|uniref:tRNA (Guanine-N1-)-methyltransferase n=1 Tax=Archaeoglobus veneficus (strain DSM 11195 / SNP6) TaxID=693661 RepID=F2KQ55_ARCVS|nr:tRNA (guanine-N1-)-methyltransferase [Archaeoglobus veneficus]AEA47658.1 tRNA (guanine-N1-)-methyltransferase [Archaeoglobus veneficus SNP6]
MRLRDVFAELLRERGIERIWGPEKSLQKLAVLVATGKAVVCRAKGCRCSIDLNGNFLNEPAQAYVGDASSTSGCDEVILTGKELVEKCRKYRFPYIAVDCSYFHLHSEKERKKLVLQLKCALGVVREFMWDEKMVITGARFEELNVLYYSSLEDFLTEKRFDKVILLDPNAENVFDGQRADCYIIGGIVDMSGNKKGLTTEIGKRLEKAGIDFEARKILLRGDVIGVPDRINSITEIILRTVLDGEYIEDAIRAVQSHVVARWRLKKELPKYTIRVDTSRPFRLVKKSTFAEFNWLNLGWKDFFEVCRQLEFVVVDDRIVDEIVANSSYDSRKNRYILKSTFNNS